MELDDKKNDAIRKASGAVLTDSALVAFLYDLLKENPPAYIEQLVRDNEGVSNSNRALFCNGWLAKYAKYLASRLTGVDYGI